MHLNDQKIKAKRFSFDNILATCLFILLMVILVWFVRGFTNLARVRFYMPRHGLHGIFNPNRVVAVEKIQSWMTFDYLNFVFQLPPAYLKDSLKINDTTYPNLQLNNYANKVHISSAQFIKNVQSAILNYGNR